MIKKLCEYFRILESDKRAVYLSNWLKKQYISINKDLIFDSILENCKYFPNIKEVSDILENIDSRYALTKDWKNYLPDAKGLKVLNNNWLNKYGFKNDSNYVTSFTEKTTSQIKGYIENNIKPEKPTTVFKKLVKI